MKKYIPDLVTLLNLVCGTCACILAVWGNLFPAFLTRGVGTSGIMPADKECGNNDGKLTVNELYQYVYKKTKYKQTPQVYPKNSSYVLFLRAK